MTHVIYVNTTAHVPFSPQVLDVDVVQEGGDLAARALLEERCALLVTDAVAHLRDETAATEAA